MQAISYIRRYKFAKIPISISGNILPFRYCRRIDSCWICDGNKGKRIVVVILPGMGLELLGLGAARLDEYAMPGTVAVLGIALVPTADATQPELAFGAQRIGALLTILQMSFVAQL